MGAGFPQPCHTVTVGSKNPPILLSNSPWDKGPLTHSLRMVYLWKLFTIYVFDVHAVDIVAYLSNDNFSFTDFFYQHLPHPSILEVLKAIQAFVVQHVVISVWTWIED